MSMDKVKWLKENGPLPQFNQQLRVVVDKSGDVVMKLHDNIHMKSKGIKHK